MYHFIILNDIYDLLQLSNLDRTLFSHDNKNDLIKVASRMLIWAKNMSHLNNELSYFNDSVSGTAKTLKELENYHALLDLDPIPMNNNSNILESSKYGIIFDKNQKLKCIFDVGNLGPDYQLGHAHADTLSFECSTRDEKVITNLGISSYQDYSKRKIQRSTKSHSTLEINDINSSDVWHTFRVGRRSKILTRKFVKESNMIFASHDGYTNIKGSPIHKRKIQIHDQTIYYR